MNTLTWLTFLMWLICSGLEIFFNVCPTDLGVSIVTVTVILAVSICFFQVLLSKFGGTSIVNTLKWLTLLTRLTCNMLQTRSRVPVNAMNKV